MPRRFLILSPLLLQRCHHSRRLGITPTDDGQHCLPSRVTSITPSLFIVNSGDTPPHAVSFRRKVPSFISEVPILTICVTFQKVIALLVSPRARHARCFISCSLRKMLLYMSPLKYSWPLGILHCFIATPFLLIILSLHSSS